MAMITTPGVRELSRRANLMPRSAIREIMTLAAGRGDVIHLEVGEPDFGTPDHIIERTCTEIRGGATRYTGNAGRETLRATIAAHVSRRVGIEISSDRVIVTVGAIGALFTALMAVLDSGDEVLLPDPGWPNYESITVLAGGCPLRYRLSASNDFLPDPDDIAKRIGPKTKAILVNSPGNPTGGVFPLDVVRAIGAIAERTGVYVISDEIYENIVFDGARHFSFLAHTPEDRVFFISGASKSYAMTGWRLGWLVCPTDTVAVATKLQEPIVSCAPAPSQAAAEAALVGPQDLVESSRRVFERRRDIFLELLGPTGLIAGHPRGAFYGLVKIPNWYPSALAFARSLVIEHGVAVVPGDTFGPSTERMLRVAFTVEDGQLREGLRRLAEAIGG